MNDPKKFLVIDLDLFNDGDTTVYDIITRLQNAQDTPGTIQSVIDELNQPGNVVYADGIGLGRDRPTKEEKG